MNPNRILIPALFSSAVLALAACSNPTPEPTPEAQASTKSAGEPAGSARQQVRERLGAKSERPKGKVKAQPVATVKVSEDDPLKGKFDLADATKDLPKEGALVATITTDLGVLECKLFDDKAPITVANFVGLARGLRPWKKGGEWVKTPAYDGTVFHRIISGFMIQGGSQNGSEETGYVIPDEIWEDANHDRPGLLCMANRGKNTNSKQFFITHGAPSHLDNGYTIFGECAPLEVVDKIAAAPVRGDKAVDPPKIVSITIARKGGGEPAPAAGASASPSGSTAASAAPSASAAPTAGHPASKATAPND